MIPKIIHQTAKSLTWEERHLTRRSQKQLPGFDFRMWSDGDNLALVEKFFPNYVDDFRNAWHGVIRADIARCLFLHEHGGIYCDTDYKFFLVPDEKFLSHACVLGVEEANNAMVGGPKVGNAFMASEKGFPLWLAFIEGAFARLRGGEKNILLIGGPHALSLHLGQNPAQKEKITLLPQPDLFPDFRFMKIGFDRHASTIGGHLCWGSWRNKSPLQQVKCRLRRVLSAVA